MNKSDLVEIGAYMKSLWPKLDPMSAEQAEVWAQKLKPFSVYDIRQAIADVYSGSKFSPKISELLEALRRRTKGEGANRIDAPWNPSQDYADQIKREKADQDENLSSFTPEMMEAFKKEILSKEPPMAWARNLPVTSFVWRDAIENRYVFQQVPYFMTVGRRRERRFMPVDEYWAVCAKMKYVPGPMEQILQNAV